MRNLVVFLVVGLAAGSAVAQGEKPTAKAPQLRQDAGALALLDKADAILYSASTAGLQDLKYRHEFSVLPGISVAVKWKAAPEKLAGSLIIAPTTPTHIRHFAESNRKVYVDLATRIAEMMTGKSNRSIYGKDELQLVEKNQVKVIAKSARTKAIYDEHLITFDERGLPVKTRSKKGGTTTDLSVSFTQREGKWFVDRVDSTATPAAGQSRKTTMGFEYAAVAGYTFPKKIKADAAAGKSEQTFVDIHPNTGLKDADFKDSDPKK